MMISVYNQTLKASTSSARQAILKNNGLHLVENAFWEIANFDPYLAYSYGMLHAFDSGKWGKHQWPLFQDHLTELQKAQLTRNVRQVPRWRGLQNFQMVTAVEFADGNDYRNILKVILPFIVDLLPRNSVVVQAIRLCGIIRTITAMNPVTKEQIRLSVDLGKKYDYSKHHNLVHLPEDLRAKGSTINYTTRPGEGFQQEVQQAYNQTNFKNTETQMTQIDENQEAIARIRTAVNTHDQLMAANLQEQDMTNGDGCPTPVVSKNHWALGSPLHSISAKKYALQYVGTLGFRNFEKKLLSFLSEHIDAPENLLEPLHITPYQCLYLHYCSMEDWQEKRDILCCNPKFHGNPQYDCVLINTNPITFGRIIALFSCHEPGKSDIQQDIALNQNLQPSSWKPKTKWEGYKVFKEKDFDFFLMKYFIRGCHFIPAFGTSNKCYYLNDMADGDTFLCFFLQERLSQSQL
ncbi:hypothetical protein M422DRAFT_276077 [Sphaerobolus stellatus SS14]|uniref:Uncharacterized protein n=1 Tax=Sphaerobolus stellatus (strain SS14) TaxID=990650 RepID=A0A0C9U2R1_SPHS4|nr:hypothetical protein M422DRAFT_276077 [Sphaerobolus stellatus SS14]